MIIKVVVNEDNDLTGDKLEFYAEVTAIKVSSDETIYKLGSVSDLFIHESDCEVVNDSCIISVWDNDDVTHIHLVGEFVKFNHGESSSHDIFDLPVSEIDFMKDFPDRLCRYMAGGQNDGVR
jgi:hypothetical protein